MIHEKNKNIETKIKNWGLPEALKEQECNIDYQFDGYRIFNKRKLEFKCEDGDVRFCLYDKTNNKALFVMEFYKRKMMAIFGENIIKLHLLYVIDDSLRDQKIAKFYVRKLQEFALNEGMECIHVEANADDDLFDNNKTNALSQLELENFYKKLSTTKMPIINISKI